MDEIIYVTSSKTQLIYKGCKYQRKEKNGDGSFYYVCVRENCSMSLTVVNDRIIREPKKHNHWPLFPVQIDIELALKKLKNELCNNTNIQTAYNNVYHQLLTKYSRNELDEYWKDWENVKWSLYYHHKKSRSSLAITQPTMSVNSTAAVTAKSTPTTVTNTKSSLKTDNKENEPTTACTSRESYNERSVIKQEKHEFVATRNQKKRFRGSELILKPKELLSVVHIDEMQSMIQSKYPQLNGLFHTNSFFDSNYQNRYFNPNTIHNAPFIQILQAEQHWVTLTNYNPFYEKSRYDVWFLYDSLNNVENIVDAIKPALKRLNGESTHIRLMNCFVHPQVDTYDSGLFAFGYAMAIAEDKDPSKLCFHQTVMRGEFNSMVETGSIQQFTHFDITRETTYREINVDLSDVHM